jgi:hypothetical protein
MGCSVGRRVEDSEKVLGWTGTLFRQDSKRRFSEKPRLRFVLQCKTRTAEPKDVRPSTSSIPRISTCPGYCEWQYIWYIISGKVLRKPAFLSLLERRKFFPGRILSTQDATRANAPRGQVSACERVPASHSIEVEGSRIVAVKWIDAQSVKSAKTIVYNLQNELLDVRSPQLLSTGVVSKFHLG